MKDIVIKGKCLKRELLIFLACFSIAIGMNIYAIITYKTQWSELWEYTHVVLLLSIVLFLLLGIIRFVYFMIKKLRTRV